MNSLPINNYKTESTRYRHYYQRLQVFYEKPATQVSAGVIFTIGVIIFFFTFAIRPTLQTIAELLRKIDDQKIVLENAKKKSAALATAQQQYDSIQSLIPVLSAAIPDSHNAQALLLQIEGSAAGLQIPLTGLHVSDLQFPPKSTASNAIQEITFTISADAPYQTIEAYLNALQSLPRLITIESVSFSATDTKNQTDLNPKTITAAIACRVYYVTNHGYTP